MLDFVFEDGFGYERYVDYLFDVPMYFSYRDGIYHDASGQSFRDFMRGKLPVLPGALPTVADWSDHMTTARSAAHTSELQSLMRISYAVFCLTKNKPTRYHSRTTAAA